MTTPTHSPSAEVILEQLHVVKLSIKLWTSAKKLRPEDLKLADGSVLPPETLASLGSKKTVDPKHLLEFTRLKKEAERVCLALGTRFIGGYANPSDKIPAITEQLDQLARQFYRERRNFLSVYATLTEDWVHAHPGFEDAIRRAIEPVTSVEQKLAFDYVVFRIAQPSANDVSLTQHTLALNEQLFHEIAQDAKELLDRSFVGKDTVTGRVLNPFRRMRDKLDSLGFLDHRCLPIVDTINQVLRALPQTGPYTGTHYHSLFALGLLLSDSERMKAHGAGLTNGQGAWFVDHPHRIDTVSSASFIPDASIEISDAEPVLDDEVLKHVAPFATTVVAGASDRWF